MSEADETFDEMISRERSEFPLEKIQALCEMEPSLGRVARAAPLLSDLIRMAKRALIGRWQTGAPPSYPVNVVCREGFFFAHHAGGRWVTRGPDGREHELHDVTGWYEREGQLAEPWHEWLESPEFGRTSDSP